MRYGLSSLQRRFLFFLYVTRSLFILEIASFQIHVVLLDPGYIIEHTPLASRSSMSSTYVPFSFCAGHDLMQPILCFLLPMHSESQRQGLHYEAMSSNMGSQRDLEDFKKFSHIFSNCLPKPGLKIIELHSIYRYHWPAGLVSIGFK